MATIGAFEAKTHLSSLLERVEKGERFTITRHGRAIAQLTPVNRRDPAEIERVIADIQSFASEHTLGCGWREARCAGRKC